MKIFFAYYHIVNVEVPVLFHIYDNQHALNSSRP